MTKQEFITKWNVAWEDKEQEQEFADEMASDIDSILQHQKSPKMGADNTFGEVNFNPNPKIEQKSIKIRYKVSVTWDNQTFDWHVERVIGRDVGYINEIYCINSMKIKTSEKRKMIEYIKKLVSTLPIESGQLVSA